MSVFWGFSADVDGRCGVRKVVNNLPCGRFLLEVAVDECPPADAAAVVAVKTVAAEHSGTTIRRLDVSHSEASRRRETFELDVSAEQAPWSLVIRATLRPLLSTARRAQRSVTCRLLHGAGTERSKIDIDLAERQQLIATTQRRLAESSSYRQQAAERGLLAPYLLALALDGSLRAAFARFLGVDLAASDGSAAHDAYLLVVDGDGGRSLACLAGSFLRQASATWSDCLQLLVQSLRGRVKANVGYQEYVRQTGATPLPTTWHADEFAGRSDAELLVQAVSESARYAEALAQAAAEQFDRDGRLCYDVKLWQLEIGRLARGVWIRDPRVQTLASRFAAHGFVEPAVHLHVLGLAAQAVVQGSRNDTERLERVRKLTTDEIVDCLENGRLLGLAAARRYRGDAAELTLTELCPFAALSWRISDYTNILASADGPLLWAAGVVLGASAVNLLALGVHQPDLFHCPPDVVAWSPPAAPSNYDHWPVYYPPPAQPLLLPVQPAATAPLPHWLPPPRRAKKQQRKPRQPPALWPIAGGLSPLPHWPSFYQHTPVAGPYGPYF